MHSCVDTCRFKERLGIRYLSGDLDGPELITDLEYTVDE